MKSTINVIKKWTKLWELLRNYGLSWLLMRLVYEVQVRSGFQERRFHQRPWADNEIANWLKPEVPANPIEYTAFRNQDSPRFLFQAENRSVYEHTLKHILGEAGRRGLIDEAKQIRQGYFRYFFNLSGHLGFPPDWHLNPFTNQRSSPTAHWSRIPMYSSETGDLKFIWEPGRFASAYTLARTYWITSNDAYAETFWQLVESWANANPPNRGAHWRCGQENSLRLMAWCFAFYAFADSPATTPHRIASLVGMIATQADRVAADRVYAHLQKNNHAISEGVGLWTVGILFPELTLAKKWREAGQKILEEEALRQIYDDGAYIQHSTNYHRLILHDLIWAIRLGDLNGYKLSSILRDKVRQAGEFLYQLQDKKSGHTPNYGANDGALILPLNGCDYRDFRPVLATAHYLFNQTRLYQAGPWDEDLVWFFGPEALEKRRVNVEKRPLRAPNGGYYTLPGTQSWGMIRCATFRDRPGQADLLHLDIWRNGVNVASDPGTYLYYSDSPWDNSLVSTLVHNTVSVDGVDQMTRGPRFLWLTWPKSQMFHHLMSKNGLLGYFEGAHFGYIRLPQPVTHRRAVLKVDQDIWITIDDLIGQGVHTFRLHWLLIDLPFEVYVKKRRVILNMGKHKYGLSLYACLPPEPVQLQYDVVRGSTDSAPRGWQSTYYGACQPTLSVVLNLQAATPCRIVSIFTSEDPDNRLLVSSKQIRLANRNLKLVANLFDPNDSSIVQDVFLDEAAGQECLNIN
ncbi:MAG: alginate lyase family protein [Planctomycetota bacterium]|jgi:asparagine synthase (glutamine-hydrolysing)